jgi:hypothetical protein
VEIMSNLRDAKEDERARFAEMFDLYATVRPEGSMNDYHVDLTANIPLEMEGDKPGAYDMVFGSSRGGLRGRGEINQIRTRPSQSRACGTLSTLVDG